jgi:hypothetical protein
VGKEDQQGVRLSESLMNSKESSDQQGVLTEEEDHRHILIIGGINIFLPSIPVEASAHVEGAAEERQPTKTVMRGEGADIDICSQGDERRRGAFRSDAHSVGEELRMLEDWLRNPGT